MGPQNRRKAISLKSFLNLAETLFCNLLSSSSNFYKVRLILPHMGTSADLVSRTLYDVPGYERFRAILIPHSTSDRGSDTSLFHQSVLETIATSSPEGLILGPEWSYFPHQPLTETERDLFLHDIQTATKGKKDLVVAPGTFVWQKDGKLYNTCFVVNNGEITFAYDKRKNGGEEAIARRYNLEWQPGVSVGNFSLDGLSFGIEICIDEDFPLYDKETNDFTLLPSCGGHPFKPFQSSFAGLRDGGYKLINDGELRAVGLVQKPLAYSLNDTTAHFSFPNDISLLFNLERLAPHLVVCDSLELRKGDVPLARIIDGEKTQDHFSYRSSIPFPRDDFQFYLESIYAHNSILRDKLMSLPVTGTPLRATVRANLLTFLQAEDSLHRVLDSFQE